MKADNDVAIRVQGLTKRFGEVRAVSAVDFAVYIRRAFWFPGSQRSRQTTTINMLTGLARPDAGTIHIGGIDCTKKQRAAQHLIGVVSDESNLYPELTGFDKAMG